MQTKRSWIGTQPSWRFLHQFPSLKVQENLQKRRQKKSGRQKRQRTLGEQGLLKQLSQAHVNPQRLKRQRQGLHRSTPGPLHTYHRFQFSTFLGLPNLSTSRSLLLVPSLFLYSSLFLLAWLVQLWYFIWSYILYFIFKVLFGAGQVAQWEGYRSHRAEPIRSTWR